MRHLLVLRPEPGAAETVRRARGLGLEARSIPLFEVVPVDWEAPDPANFDGLLLTSANAVRNAGRQLERLRMLPVHAVGEASAETARALGLKIVSVGDGGIEQLLASIDANLKLLHLCGADRRIPRQASQQIESIVVYRAAEIKAPDLSRAAGSVALIHSPRGGAQLARLVGERASIAIAAISEAAADAVGDGWESISVAEEPRDDALLALAARLCNNPQPK